MDETDAIINRVSENLNLLMAKERLNANQLARKTNIPASTIKKIRNHDNPNPTLATLVPLANYFSISVAQLVGDSDVAIAKNHDLNVSIPSSIPILTINQLIPELPARKPSTILAISSERHYSDGVFAIKLPESMGGIFAKDGLIVVEPRVHMKHLDYVLILVEKGQNVVIKQVFDEGDGIHLRSLLIQNHITPVQEGQRVMGVIQEYRQYLNETR
jgi:transcriptional regulator with XRE-family HTH domain